MKGRIEGQEGQMKEGITTRTGKEELWIRKEKDERRREIKAAGKEERITGNKEEKRVQKGKERKERKK